MSRKVECRTGPLIWWYRGWTMIALAIAFQILVLGIIEACFSFWVAPWMKEFATQRAPIMVAATSTLIVGAVVAPFAGRLLDQWSIRGVIAIGLLIFSFGFASMPLVHALWQIVAIYGITTGVSLMLVGPLATQTLAARWFQKRQGLAMGIVVTGAPLGGIVMPPILASLLSKFDWRSVAFFVAAAAAILALVAYLFVRDSPESANVSIEGHQDGHRSHPGSNDVRWGIRELLRNASFWGVALAFFGIYAIGMGLSANFRPLAADLGVSAADTGFLTSLLNIFALLNIIIVGKLADRFDHRALLMTYVLMVSAALLMMTGDSHGWRFTIAVCVFGVGVSCFYPLQGAIVGRYFGASNFGRVLGLLNVFFVLGAVGGPVGGAIRDHFGRYELYLIGTAIILPFLGLFIFLLGGAAATSRKPLPGVDLAHRALSRVAKFHFGKHIGAAKQRALPPASALHPFDSLQGPCWRHR